MTSSREAKALAFKSDASRITGNGIDYDPGLDSAKGGGADGGFPFWEANNDWAVTESASCKVAGRNKMTKVAGTKEQSLSCYVDWMNGSRQYVDLSHCEAGANNLKPAETKSYLPPSCPHPEWVFDNWGGWYNISGWYRAWAHRGRTCGTVTEYIRQKRTRSVSCKNGTYQECKIYNGPAQTAQTRTISRSRYLGSCLPYFVIRYHISVYSSGWVKWHSPPRCVANCAGVNASNADAWSSGRRWSITWKNYSAYYHGSLFKVHKVHSASSSRSRLYRYMDIRIPNKYK